METKELHKVQTDGEGTTQRSTRAMRGHVTGALTPTGIHGRLLERVTFWLRSSQELNRENSRMGASRDRDVIRQERGRPGRLKPTEGREKR